MKTTKLIIGIVSCVLTFLILMQSCVATLGDALADEGGSSGVSGVLVAVLLVTAGIVAIAARSSRGGAIFCTAAYGAAGVLGLASEGVYSDLKVWGVLSLIFALVFLVSVIRFRQDGKKRTQTIKEEKEAEQ